jgi:myo-inositol 2-dehydrogenase / D-chiro-inositol 1-dehydrogenase
MSDLRIAVLGVGVMGAFHARTLATVVRGADVTVVSDFSAERAAQAAAAVGARVVGDPFAAIADPEVDAVVIASPGAAHAEQVLECLRRGIPVLCEKPLTTSVESAYRVVRAEAELGRTLIQVGFMRRFDSEYAALRELIAGGGLGDPLLVHCTHRNADNGPHFDSEMMIRDSVVHEVDAVRFLLDEEIVAVRVVKGRPTPAAPQGFSDPMMVILETAGGRIATDEIFVRAGIGYEVRTEVVGSAGVATIGLDQHLVTRGTDGRWGGAIAPGFLQRFAAAYTTEVQRWVAAATRGTIDGPGAWDGYAAVAVCEAAVQAVHTGERVPVRMQPRP